MRVCIIEDARVNLLEPLALTRPVFELRTGCLSLFEKIERSFHLGEVGCFVRPVFAEYLKQKHPLWHINDKHWLQQGDLLVINGRWLAPMNNKEKPSLGTTHLCNDDVVLAYLKKQDLQSLCPQSAQAIIEIAKTKNNAVRNSFAGSMIQYPWDLVEHNATEIMADLPRILTHVEELSDASFEVRGSRRDLYVSTHADVEPMVLFDTTRGPVIVSRGVSISAFSRIEGPAFLAPFCQIHAAKIRTGTTIGPHCRVGGEIENSIFHGCSNKYHEGFIGHSYVGEWVNLGAGTQNSDLRNDYGHVQVPIFGEATITGLTKVGCFIGDHTKTALNTILNTGSNLGCFSNVIPSGMLAPKYIPSFSTLWRGKIQENSDLDGNFKIAEKVMSRRGMKLNEPLKNIYRSVFDETNFVRNNTILERERKNLYRYA